MNEARRVEVPAGANYHETVAGVSQSMLKAYRDDPGKYRDRYVLGQTEEIPESRRKIFQWGKDFERLIFTDELPGVLVPQEVLARSEREGKAIYSRRGAEWTEWKERTLREQPGARLLRQDEWDKEIAPLLQARDQLRAHTKANKLLDGDRNVALAWEDEATGMPCKCEIDVVSRWRTLTDLKTAQSASPADFLKAIWNFGYHIQAYWYRRAWQRLTGEDWPFVFVVVQKTPSYKVETFDLAPAWYDMAAQQIGETMQQLKASYDTNQWTTATFGKVTTLEPATWMTYQV